MKFASVLGDLVAIQVLSKYLESLLPQSSSLLRQDIHVCISISKFLSISRYNFQKVEFSPKTHPTDL